MTSTKRATKHSARSRSQPEAKASLFTRLGLHGLDSIEPVVLASLATESPLLLIGVHGSGKSLLLERIADALGLAWRHYNASLLNFDDLVGYPLPDADGHLRFIQTPASVWGAQAVLIDEISRARIDIQNRLFPIIHEKKVQGLPLGDLRHRWAAMNPPGCQDDDELAYAGSEPLDLALSDRFAFQVSVPDWRQFDEPTQEQVIQAGRQAVDPQLGAALFQVLNATAIALPIVQAQWGPSVARYVRLLSGLLESSGHVLSARRAGMVARNIVAVHAVRQAIDAEAQMGDSAWTAVLSSMPFAASGIRLNDSVLLACHKEAWRVAAVAPDDPMGAILGERDPLRRVQLALAATRLPEGELTTIIVDALSSMAEGARHALAEWLLESGAVERLSVVAADEAARAYRDVACLQEVYETVRPNSARHKVWKLIQQRLGSLDHDEPLAERQANLLASLFSRSVLAREEQVDEVLQAFLRTRERLHGAAIPAPSAAGALA